jgi:oxaloacetate decarboxylase (Na+ extruding) subunit alpha
VYQVPGGMLSNLLSQLKQAGQEDKMEAVLQEVPRVRKDAGYPPLVTPTSQIVGTQAVLNVITGERYKMCTNEFKDLVAGKIRHHAGSDQRRFRQEDYWRCGAHYLQTG